MVAEVNGHCRPAEVHDFRGTFQLAAFQSIRNLMDVRKRELRHQAGIFVESQARRYHRSCRIGSLSLDDFPTLVEGEQAMDGIAALGVAKKVSQLAVQKIFRVFEEIVIAVNAIRKRSHEGITAAERAIP